MNMPKQYQFWLNMLIVMVFTITVMLHHFTVIHNKELISLERRVPSLGLDFILEYNITGGHRDRSKKQSTEPTKQSLGEKCNSPKKLHNIDLLSQQELELEGRIVMTETSGSAALNPRQACGVESAARRSGMDVVVVMMNESLLLTDNTTCHLVTQYNNIQFFSVNITNLALNTSLEKFITTPGILTKLVPAHKSDILRSLLVYKFGGLYLDTDILTLNDLTHYHDFLVNWQPPGKSPMMLNSCAFSFRRGHPLLKMVIDKIEASYNPSVWTSIGPSLFTACLKEFTGVSTFFFMSSFLGWLGKLQAKYYA